MYEVFWEFQPAAQRERDFEFAYGASGPWVALFRRDPDYLGTELIPPREAGGWYRTVDRWESAAAYERFQRTWRSEYEALDRACEALTSAERPVTHSSSGT